MMTFAYPTLLLLLIVIPIIAVLALLVSRHKRKQWQEFVADRLRPQLLRTAGPWPRRLSLLCLLTGLAFLIIALARPQLEEATQTETTRGRNVIIVLDLSRSMLANDLKPSRLDQAKALIYELLETLPNDRIGIVGFASMPYLFAPLTSDHIAVRETVEQLDCDSIPTGGSNVADAVNLAVATLKETAQQNNGLLILSDGEEHSPELLKTLDDIKQSGTYVFAVGMGTDEGSFIPDANFPDGRFRDVNDQEVITRLQADVLRSFAEKAGGRFALAQSASDIPQMIAAAVADLESFELKGREKVVATELFQWFLIPSVLLLIASHLMGTKWRPSRTVASMLLMGFCWFSPQETDAAQATLPEARAALAAEDFARAQKCFEQLAEQEPPLSENRASLMLGKATADYRLKDYAAARKSYSEALTAEDSSVRSAAHQGMSNTLFQLGWAELADGAVYPDAKVAPEKFEELLQKRMEEWMTEEQGNADQPSNGLRRMQTIMLNWADAVRHSQSALELRPNSKAAKQNGNLARHYLEKLRQKMEQQQKEMQAQMQGQGEQEGQEPGASEGEGEEEGEGEGQPKDPKDGKGKNDQEGKDDPNGKTPDPEKPDPNNTHGKDQRPGETKEDRALRKLKENADLQRGIVAPGRHEYRRPAKDW
jgi:Ca-activated chloride channel family protein